MSMLISWGLLMALAIVLVPVSVLLVQVICALPRRRSMLPVVSRPRLVVLIPAHDEAPCIGNTVRSVLPQLVEGDRLVVVADNCSDGTAQAAAAAGAEVVKRRNASRCGKGYALDFGVRYLAHDPPDLVVIVDGDCEMTPGSIDVLARLSASTGRPVQALDLMKSPKDAGTSVQIAEFAWVVKNLVRPLGFLRLGLPCQLMGTGMALPWELIRSLRLASGHLVEDMQMGADCARAGLPPLFCPEARVLSYFPSAEGAIRSQRTRWEHGHLAMITSEVPRLLLDGIRGKGAGLLALALDMCVPPLALLTLVVLALLGVSAVYALATSVGAPLVVAGIELLMLVAALGLAWMRFGSELVSVWKLLRIVPYILQKLPLYLRFLVRRQVDWVRSKRDGS